MKHDKFSKNNSSYESKEDKYGDKYNPKYSEEMEDALDDGGRKNRKFSNSNKKKTCRFTAGEEDAANITYKNPKFLSTFMTEHGKIVPRRVTGNCAYIQRLLTQEIKRARHLSLLGFTSIGPNSNY